MRVLLDHAQHQGMRSEQQDAVLISNQANDAAPFTDVLAIVADGMGGMRCGKEASEIAAARFLASYENKSAQASMEDALLDALRDANEGVKSYAEDHSAIGEMGSTLVAGVIRGNRFYWVSVGDSRIYLCNGSGLYQLNKEHNLRNRLVRLVKDGLLDADEIDADPQADALTSFIGIEQLKEIDMSGDPIQLRPGDAVLLYSDGLFKTLSDSEIYETVAAYAGNGLAERLVAQATSKQKRHQDNVSVAVLYCSSRVDGLNIAQKEAQGGGKYRNELTAITVLGTQPRNKAPFNAGNRKNSK